MSPRFADRHDAGRELAKALPDLDPKTTVVLALPRGGVPVADPVCEALGVPLDLIYVRKIGLPHQPELAVGAVVNGDDPTIIVNDQIAEASRLSRAQIRAMGKELLPEIAKRKALYSKDRSTLPITGKTVIVVDDGLATGATMRAALASLKRKAPERIILALPTAPTRTLDEIAPSVDDVICLTQPSPFFSVGASYRSFTQTTDGEVIAAMVRHAPSAASNPDN